MENLTGFYDLSVLKTKEQIQNFFKDCIELSYHSNIQKLDSIYREIYKQSDISLSNAHVLANEYTHNVFIDRRVQHPNTDDFIEAGYRIMNYKEPDIFLYCFIHEDNANKIIEKYNLIME